ncbi:MAG: hypothetical protein E7594_01555 [Ruminococcaceae bacterium]|nr:hypothetical protein [Oscillospiraceae bacterium]
MKKIGRFLLHSLVLFWSYFLSSFLCLLVLQTVMRLFVEADSKGEYFWKSVCMYAFMLGTCMVYLKVTASTHKTQYLAYMNGREWSFKKTLAYILKNPDYWSASLGFAIWPVILPKLFGAIHRLYVSPELLISFPRAILSVLTVSLPIVVLSAVAWLLVLRLWCKNRMHKE